jgi:hypothetical protein
MYHTSNMLFWSWEVWHILPSYEQIIIITKFVRMDTVRIGFFLGELYGLSCCACDIGKAFLYGKTKEKVYITSGPEFGVGFYGQI